MRREPRTDLMRSTDLSDPSGLGFRLYSTRLRLLYRLKKEGFYVRMHAYEYLAGDEEGFLALIFLEPWVGRCFILPLRHSEKIAEILKLIEKLDTSIKVETIKRNNKNLMLP